MNQLNIPDSIFETSHPDTPIGFVYLLSTATLFSMDLIGKNLQLNGIDVQWNYADGSEAENGPSTLYVKKEYHEQALSILTTLDLLDFTTHHGK